MIQRIAVAHVVLSLDCGGLERIVLDLIRAGQSLGQQVSVICLERTGAMATEAEQLGSQVVCVEKGSGIKISAVAKIKKILSELKCDVLHTHQIGALLYAGSAARLRGAPLVVHTEHGKHYSGGIRKRAVGRAAGYYANRFFCVSEDIAKAAVAQRVVPARKVAVVRNGIDLSRFKNPKNVDEVRKSLGIPLDAQVIGTVGRLSEVKSQDRLLRATAKLLAEANDVHLLIVGDGELREDLLQQAQDLGISERTHFVGYQTEPERFIGAMNVFALTSRSEGMPLAILEAWAAGLPVVASRVGGIPEIVENGLTGLLFDPDDEDALKTSLKSFLVDAERAKRFGEAGQQLVEANYSRQRMAETYHSHYLELLRSRMRSNGAISGREITK